jgi:hypothetical protein
MPPKTSTTSATIDSYRYCSRSSIQWLYLRHRFVKASLCRTTPSDTILPLHFPINPIDKVVCRSSLILDTALLDFHDAAVRLESTTNTLTEALEYDAHCPASACSPSIDSLNHLVGIISLILDDELFDFDEAHEQLDTAVQGIESAFGDDVDTIAHLTPLTTSDQHEMSTSNLGPTARHTTRAASASTPLPSTPLYHRYSVDPGTISDHPTPVSLMTHHEHDRTYATPSLSPSSRMDNSYAYGCNTSLASVDEHHTNLQPHEFVSDDNNNKHEKQTLTTIYTQNAQGLWRRPRDADGAILVDQPPDLSKLEYLIDYMCQNDVGAWMIQETWEEGDEFDIDVNGYHIFRHNANCGESGRAHLSRGVAIILSPLFYDVWKAAGSPPPITTNHNDDFVGRFMQMNLKFDSFDSRGRRIKGKVLSKALILAYFPCDDQRHDQFCALLDSVLSSIGPSTQIILGGDINTAMNTETRLDHMVSHEVTRAVTTFSKFSSQTGSEWKTPSFITTTTNTSPTPASPHITTHVEYQVCMTYLPVLFPSTNAFKIVLLRSWVL